MDQDSSYWVHCTLPLRVPGDRSPSPLDWTACHGLGEGFCSDVAAPEARGRNRNRNRNRTGGTATVAGCGGASKYLAFSRTVGANSLCPFTAGLGVRTHSGGGGV
jgi:hypothetical protein